MMQEQAAPLTFTTPAWKCLLFACLSAGFVMVGWFLVAAADTTTFHGLKGYVAGWAAIIFFGPCGIVLALQIFPRFRQRLTVEEDGFEVRTWRGVRRYRWADVAGSFQIYKVRRTKLVVFDNAQAGRNLNTAFSGFNSSLPAQLGIPPEQLARLMNDRLTAARGGRSGHLRSGEQFLG
ncbi:MAG TPA: PH domain-containing protein [Acidisphaera sp.]|nr:PH domain-containing protein [Acidisphaera sp.]